MSLHEHQSRALPDPAIRPTISVPVCARILGVAPRTLYDAIDRGEFECIRIRNRLVISSSYVLEILKTGSNNE